MLNIRLSSSFWAHFFGQKKAVWLIVQVDTLDNISVIYNSITYVENYHRYRLKIILKHFSGKPHTCIMCMKYMSCRSHEHSVWSGFSQPLLRHHGNKAKTMHTCTWCGLGKQWKWQEIKINPSAGLSLVNFEVGILCNVKSTFKFSIWMNCLLNIRGGWGVASELLFQTFVFLP